MFLVRPQREIRAILSATPLASVCVPGSLKVPAFAMKRRVRAPLAGTSREIIVRSWVFEAHAHNYFSGHNSPGFNRIHRRYKYAAIPLYGPRTASYAYERRTRIYESADDFHGGRAGQIP